MSKTAVFFLKTPLHLQRLGQCSFPEEYDGPMPEQLWTEPLPPDPEYPLLVVHTQAGVAGTKPFSRKYEVDDEVAYIYDQGLKISKQ